MLFEHYGINYAISKLHFDNIVGAGVFIDNKLVSMGFVTQVIRIPCDEVPAGIYGELHGVYTSPAYRRNGYAQVCCNKLLEKCNELKMPYVSCDAKCIAKDMYYKLGFIRQSDDEMRSWKIL